MSVFRQKDRETVQTSVTENTVPAITTTYTPNALNQYTSVSFPAQTFDVSGYRSNSSACSDKKTEKLFRHRGFQPQLPLALLFIRSVAEEAVVGQNWAHFVIEIRNGIRAKCRQNVGCAEEQCSQIRHEGISQIRASRSRQAERLPRPEAHRKPAAAGEGAQRKCKDYLPYPLSKSSWGTMPFGWIPVP